MMGKDFIKPALNITICPVKMLRVESPDSVVLSRTMFLCSFSISSFVSHLWEVHFDVACLCSCAKVGYKTVSGLQLYWQKLEMKLTSLWLCRWWWWGGRRRVCCKQDQGEQHDSSLSSCLTYKEACSPQSLDVYCNLCTLEPLDHIQEHNHCSRCNFSLYVESQQLRNWVQLK